MEKEKSEKEKKEKEAKRKKYNDTKARKIRKKGQIQRRGLPPSRPV